jgi:hypothetical protein
LPKKTAGNSPSKQIGLLVMPNLRHKVIFNFEFSIYETLDFLGQQPQNSSNVLQA